MQSLTRRNVAQPAKTRNVSVRAASRATWLPGMVPPAHLQGKLAGDSGFDPLGLGQDANRLKWWVWYSDGHT